jgi:hypothetical protein
MISAGKRSRRRGSGVASCRESCRSPPRLPYAVTATASLSAASLQFNGKLTHPLRDFGRAWRRSRPSHERSRPSPSASQSVCSFPSFLPLPYSPGQSGFFLSKTRVGRSPCTVAATARSLRLYTDVLHSAKTQGGSMFDFISRRANTEGLRRGAPHEAAA